MGVRVRVRDSCHPFAHPASMSSLNLSRGTPFVCTRWCKQRLGANAILAVSLAVAKAGAAASGVPL